MPDVVRANRRPLATIRVPSGVPLSASCFTGPQVAAPQPVASKAETVPSWVVT